MTQQVVIMSPYSYYCLRIDFLPQNWICSLPNWFTLRKRDRRRATTRQNCNVSWCRGKVFAWSPNNKIKQTRCDETLSRVARRVSVNAPLSSNNFEWKPVSIRPQWWTDSVRCAELRSNKMSCERPASLRRGESSSAVLQKIFNLPYLLHLWMCFLSICDTFR